MKPFIFTLTFVVALKLAKAFNTTPQYWMNLQANYDLWQAGKQSDIVENIPELAK